MSSLSSSPIPHTKNREAYCRYTTLKRLSVGSKTHRFLQHILKHLSSWKRDIWFSIRRIYTACSPLNSRKLHRVRCRRVMTRWLTSRTIFAFAFGARGINHFARRNLPDIRLWIHHSPRRIDRWRRALSWNEQNILNHGDSERTRTSAS